MSNDSSHPMFEKILAPLAPKEEDAFTQLEKMHLAALRANTSLIRGYSLLLAALKMDGVNRETLREIIGNACDKAAKEMDYKNSNNE